MKFIALFIVIITATSAFGDVSKENVETMLNQMVKEEVISAKEAEKARIRLHSINNKQWKMMNSDAHKVAARGPASISESGDLHSAQFKQIQDDVKKLVPSN